MELSKNLAMFLSVLRMTSRRPAASRRPAVTRYPSGPVDSYRGGKFDEVSDKSLSHGGTPSSHPAIRLGFLGIFHELNHPAINF
jgi:hypothetical protein